MRGILKTFAILLIFFLKWVKLFYDFRRVLRPLLSLFSSLFRGVVARVTPESNPRPPPSHSRHREKRNSLFVSFSPPRPPRPPPVPSSTQPVLSTDSPHPTPFLSRLLYATESISRVFSRASPPPPHFSPSPPEDSFRELCGKFPLLPLPNLSTSTLFQPRQLIISFSMNPAISISVS